MLIFFSISIQAQTPDLVDTNRLITKMKTIGIVFGAAETLEGYYNAKGGIRSGSAYASTLDANMRIDLQKLIGLNDGLFYINMEYHAGENPSSKLIGDAQVFDKHNANPFFQTLELWYQQKLFNNKLRIKIGKIDANSEFSVIDNGLEFINSSTQVTPTFFVFPTFPDPVPSANLFFTPNNHISTSIAIDEANQKGRFLNFYGNPTSVQPTLNGILLISESSYSWSRPPIFRKDGNLKIGLWQHTGTFQKLDGNIQKGVKGIYLIANQTLWTPNVDTNNQGRGIRAFLEYARTKVNIAPVYQHYGGGLLWTGLTAGHPADALGFSAQYVDLSPELQIQKHYELNFESFYKLWLNQFLNVKLDAQYILKPGGRYSDALVGTILLSVSI